MKLAGNVEWRVTDDSIFIVDTESNKVLSGNVSVKIVFEEMLSGAEEKEKIAEIIIEKYNIDIEECKEIYQDVSDVVSFLCEEGIFE